MSLLKKTIYTAAAAGTAYIGISALMARGLITPSRGRRHAETPATVGLAYESVEFPSRDGEVTLRGWLMPPPGSVDMQDAMTLPWIVLVHGHGSSISDASSGLLSLARDVHDRNYGVLMFDLRACGESGGGHGTVGYFERFDVLGAIDYLAHRGVERNRIGVLGNSLGGAVALLACSSPGTAGAVVSDSSFADLWLMIRRAQGGIKSALAFANPGMDLMARLLYGIDIGEISPAKALTVAELPLLIIHGADDRVVPVGHARLLAKAAGILIENSEPGPRSAWIVPGAGHVGAYRLNPGAYVDRVSAFFDAHLRSADRTRAPL